MGIALLPFDMSDEFCKDGYWCSLCGKQTILNESFIIFVARYRPEYKGLSIDENTYYHRLIEYLSIIFDIPFQGVISNDQEGTLATFCESCYERNDDAIRFGLRREATVDCRKDGWFSMTQVRPIGSFLQEEYQVDDGPNGIFHIPSLENIDTETLEQIRKDIGEVRFNYHPYIKCARRH